MKISSYLKNSKDRIFKPQNFFMFTKNFKFLAMIVFILIISPLVLAEDYCQNLKNIIESKSEQKCGDVNYTAFADIDKDGNITLIDLILVDTNSADQQWCLDRFNDTEDPCTGPSEQPIGGNNYNSIPGSGGTVSSTEINKTDKSSLKKQTTPSEITNQQTESPETISIAGVQIKKPTPNLILLWISSLVVILVIIISLYFLIKHLIEIRKNNV